MVPIRQIYERWVGRFEELWASHLLRIKEDAETANTPEPHDNPKKRAPKGLTPNAAQTPDAIGVSAHHLSERTVR